MELYDWWGYLHTSGTIHAKRYFNIKDIQEATESPFVKRVCPPFRAANHDEALKKVEEYLGANKGPTESYPDEIQIAFR